MTSLQCNGDAAGISESLRESQTRKGVEIYREGRTSGGEYPEIKSAIDVRVIGKKLLGCRKE
ncbi:hypothetical protein RvY_11162 [Ramazzottius varieornatus]|uniref:Uncharacterized protein n=1 Tax=Ramazzottius varieornatus TaxID=947166 RepID=A0A1D1VFA2_RAMVA|nr:hypothetical protein RvY_11162 [Ramazzottius varieornatus]